MQAGHIARAAVLFVAALLGAWAGAAERVPGKAYFGRNDYIEYVAGNLPFILSAPHGGRDRPEELPNRDQGTMSYDRGTQEMAREIIREFHERTGGWPHIIICRLSRVKVDCNCEIVEAAAGNPHAEQAWQEYQGFIEEARAAVERQHGRGFYIDLHGHGHKEQQLELGYLHYLPELQVSDEELNHPRYAAASSLRGIAALNRRPYAELIRGPLSFGALMEQHGFPATPSPRLPKPTAPYFRGGYNTQRHANGGVPLAGLQIETNYQGARDKPENHVRFAKALYETLAAYLPAHMGLELQVAKSPEPPAEVAAVKQVAPACQPQPVRGRRLFRRRCRCF